MGFEKGAKERGSETHSIICAHSIGMQLDEGTLVDLVCVDFVDRASSCER